MQIKFLGTSASWPLPRLGCTCQICTSTDSRDKRSRSSVLVNGQILIDAGPDIYWQLRREKIDATKITHCLITHRHHDHTAGLYDLEKIYNRKEGLKIIRGNGKHEEYQIDNSRITFFRVLHTSTPTCGLRIDEGKKSFVYIPDVRKVPQDSLKFCRKANLLVIDGSSLGSVGETKGHLSIEENIPVVKNILKPRFLYYTHIGHKTLPHKELEAYVQKEGGLNFHIAYDGLEIGVV